MTDTERLKNRLEEIQKEEKSKESKEKEYMEEMKTNEEKRLENEKQRKKLREEEEKLQQNFSNKLGSDVAQSKKLFGFLKRYVLIGIVTGVPGIALTYLWDKWQENKMVKDLYEKNIELVANPNNKDLAKEYELLRRKFYKAYDIDKIERLVKTSKDIEKLKNDNKLLEKLNEEIRKCREEYEKNLGNYIENQIVSEIHEETEETTVVEETEEDEEPEIGDKISMK